MIRNVSGWWSLIILVRSKILLTPASTATSLHHHPRILLVTSHRWLVHHDVRIVVELLLVIGLEVLWLWLIMLLMMMWLIMMWLVILLCHHVVHMTMIITLIIASTPTGIVMSTALEALIGTPASSCVFHI